MQISEVNLFLQQTNIIYPKVAMMIVSDPPTPTPHPRPLRFRFLFWSVQSVLGSRLVSSFKPELTDVETGDSILQVERV